MSARGWVVGLGAATLCAAAFAGCGRGSYLASTATTAPAPTPGPPAAVSASFFGVVSPESFVTTGAARDRLLARQRAAGVGLVRQTFDWAQLQPRGTGALAWGAYDTYMAATARAGIAVLPVLFGAPAGAGTRPAAGVRVSATTVCPPHSPAAFAAFAAALARRYGPTGTFWRAHPRLPRRPIRAWQVWNEPNLPPYWCGRPDAAAYVALLSATHRALRAVDPHATVVTAGLPDSRLGVPLTRYVRQLYAAGARGTFEALAVHPYAATTAGVLAAVRGVRAQADAAGDRSSLWVTELGWASGGPPSAFTVTPARQAALVGGTLAALVRERGALRLRGVVYFDWRDAPPYAGKGDFWGLHTGLLTRGGAAKPALAAYAAVAKRLNAG